MVGKSGKENVSNGLSIRTKSGSSLPRKMALSEWVNSVSNQLDELVARSGDKEVTSVRSMEEDDLGDYRDVEVEVVLEDQVDGKGDGVVTEDVYSLRMRHVVMIKWTYNTWLWPILRVCSLLLVWGRVFTGVVVYSQLYL
ncbi:hypothetical protein V6N12_047371 [Hibiscus sabdariffa]|uniref:Uncharacterized protein n=1 Tax=Hibiscus sabdariffa TaxID=183260 RepID=A0ABR2DAN9_9ROSI